MRNKVISIVRVEGTENLADALTKYVDTETLRKHIEGTGCRILEGRHELMPHVAQGEGDQNVDGGEPGNFDETELDVNECGSDNAEGDHIHVYV